VFNVLILFDNIINFFPLLGNSYVVGTIQTERGTGVSGLESGINIVIRSSTLVSSTSLTWSQQSCVYACMHIHIHSLLKSQWEPVWSLTCSESKRNSHDMVESHYYTRCSTETTAAVYLTFTMRIACKSPHFSSTIFINNSQCVNACCMHAHPRLLMC